MDTGKGKKQLWEGYKIIWLEEELNKMRRKELVNNWKGKIVKRKKRL
jgi:hypothetical protein